MVSSSLRWRAALIAAVAVLTLAVPAGASTGAPYASVEQVGYAATGAQFAEIFGSVYLRQPAPSGPAARSSATTASGRSARAGLSRSNQASVGTPANPAAQGSTPKGAPGTPPTATAAAESAPVRHNPDYLQG